jgi:hypothetical protein
VATTEVPSATGTYHRVFHSKVDWECYDIARMSELRAYGRLHANPDNSTSYCDLIGIDRYHPTYYGGALWMTTCNGRYADNDKATNTEYGEDEQGLMQYPTASDGKITVSFGGSRFVQISMDLYSSTSTTTGRSYRTAPNVFPKWNGYISEFHMR